MIQALANEEVRQAAMSGDHITFLNAINRLGYTGGMEDASDSSVDVPAASESANVNLNVNVSVTVTLGVVAIVVAAVLVVVAVAAQPIDEPGSDVAPAVARALGGPSFSVDVIHFEARNRIKSIIAAISDGSVVLPDGVTTEMAIRGLNRALDKHLL